MIHQNEDKMDQGRTWNNGYKQIIKWNAILIIH